MFIRKCVLMQNEAVGTGTPPEDPIFEKRSETDSLSIEGKKDSHIFPTKICISVFTLMKR